MTSNMTSNMISNTTSNMISNMKRMHINSCNYKHCYKVWIMTYINDLCNKAIINSVHKYGLS